MKTKTKIINSGIGLGILEKIPSEWKEIWEKTGMPEFISEDKESFDSVLVHFRNADDRKQFLEMLGESATEGTRRQHKSIWYPKVKIDSRNKFAKRNSNIQIPIGKYPIYIISKGRWESRMTSKALEKLELPYHIVIEPQEYDNYAAVIAKEKILVLPFSNLGQGSIPARNWVWEHSISTGAKRHWILDDNIRGFFRLHENKKLRVVDENPFISAETFVDNYTNIGMAGLQYDYFAPRKTQLNPFTLNTRIYSCILLDNSITHRWRGRYNEDTDLSLRILKDGLCTVLFYNYLAEKITTMTMKGGNMEELYKDDGRLKMAESLRDQHPDCVKVTFKWSRWQHTVNYKLFKNNRLIPISIVSDTTTQCVSGKRRVIV